MRVLVIGNGAREHTLAWCAARSPIVSSVAVAPGNAGTARVGQNVPVDPLDAQAVAAVARAQRADLVVVGADDPLAAGVVDALARAGIRAFGPTQAAAQIEASKVWSKQFMTRHGIPTAPFEVFGDAAAGHRFLEGRPRTWEQVAVKADGLARGKGVIVCDSDVEAHEAVTSIMEQRVFGDAGRAVVIERRLSGPEASVFALCDGETARFIGAARDHKRLLDGDRGPNTGGMGAYSPTALVPPGALDDVMRRIVRPAVTGMAAEGRPFVGFLYAGLMFTPDGPHVIEFNARFGDPEAQAVLPRLETDLVEAIEAALDGRLAGTELRFAHVATCAVCLASEGYPEKVRDGFPVKGLEAVDPDALVFHAGTIERDGQLITKGGRILTVVGRGSTLAGARAHAYANVERIHFEGMQYRRDIGEGEALTPCPSPTRGEGSSGRAASSAAGGEAPGR
ncbi:MAG: phosphoribosylamine--glycine ligase [Chloroflexi bacterium]|nr:phosphoribosylamine--glycine ligase [Chloroflexota bacterium]